MAQHRRNVSRRRRLEKKESINLDPSVLALVVRTRKLGVNQKEDVTMVYFDSWENYTCARMCSHHFGP
jgi:hypothetical protein